MRQLPSQEMFNILVKILLVGTWQKKNKPTVAALGGARALLASSCFRKTMLILSRLFLSLKHTPWRAGSQRLGAREDESSQDCAAAAEPGGRNPSRRRAWTRRAASLAPGGGDGGAGVWQVWGHTLTRCHSRVSSSLGPPSQSFVLSRTCSTGQGN